jgi:hypothetical protein
MELVLRRIYTNNGDLKIEKNKVLGGTIGYIHKKFDPTPLFLTLERPLFTKGKTNQRDLKITSINESTCIPIGRYEIEMTYSKTFDKQLYLIKNVIDRLAIRTHEANVIDQLLGCIALGYSLKQNVNFLRKGSDISINYQYFLSESKKAVEGFHNLLKEKNAFLEIVDDNQKLTQKTIENFLKIKLKI